jgi:chromosome segregation ATPase
MSDDLLATILATLNRLESVQLIMSTEMARRDDLINLRVDTMRRLDRLQNSVTAIRDDIAVNYASVDHARVVNDNTRDELRALNDTVSRMSKQVQRLQSNIQDLQSEVQELKGEPT